MGIQRFVLRNIRSGSISSRPDQARLANLLKASELISTTSDGIPALLADDIRREWKTLRKVTLTHKVDLVKRRHRSSKLKLGNTFKALVDLFLNGRAGAPQRNKTSISFYGWLQSELRKAPANGKAPNAVQMLVYKGSPIRYMGARQIRDTYTLIRKMQS